jgi:hypothetical protein
MGGKIILTGLLFLFGAIGLVLSLCGTVMPNGMPFALLATAAFAWIYVIAIVIWLEWEKGRKYVEKAVVAVALIAVATCLSGAARKSGGVLLEYCALCGFVLAFVMFATRQSKKDED